MKSSKLLTGAVMTAVIAAGTVSPAFAWHPQGAIVKTVQNVTSNSATADANDATTALTAKPGDILKYTMTVTNPAPAASNQYNDLAFIKVSDTLPSGVELVSGAKDKDFGSAVVVPQATAGNGTKSVSYSFTARVSATAKDKDVICNLATYSGNSVVKDAPRTGQDKACVVVIVPPTPVTVTPETPKVETPKAETPQVLAAATTTPEAIPATGSESVLLSSTGLAAGVYAVSRHFQSRRK